MAFEMRLATADDVSAVRAMIHARCEWMEERGLPSWRESVDDLSEQCVNPCGDVWLLVRDDGRLVGRTTVQDQAPPWGWTPGEVAEPAYYLSTTVTDPAFCDMKLGTLMAWWAVDRAARDGRAWVRRDCVWSGLVRYYQRQGFALFHEVQHTRHRRYLLGRRSESLDLPEWFRSGTPSLPSAG